MVKGRKVFIASLAGSTTTWTSVVIPALLARLGVSTEMYDMAQLTVVEQAVSRGIVAATSGILNMRVPTHTTHLIMFARA